MEESLASKPRLYFEVEKVIGISNDGHYQVQWAPAWVSKFQLAGCEHLIQDFLQQQSEKANEPVTQIKASNGSNDHWHETSDERNFQLNDAAEYEQLNLTKSENLQYSQSQVAETSDGDGDTHEDEHNHEIDPATVNIKIEECDEAAELVDISSLPTFAGSSYSMAFNNYIDDVSGEDPSTSTGANPIPAGGPTQIPEVNNTDLRVVPAAKARSVQHSNASNVKKRGSKKQFLVQVENEPCVCRQCNKTFNKISSLKQHLRTHDQDRRYACSYCTSTFSNSHNLKQHLRTHTGEKPFHCEVCSKSFRVKSHLTDHRRIHMGSKPYKCETCGRTFSQSSHRKQHMRRCTSAT